MKNKICPVCGKPLGRNEICCCVSCYAQYRSHKRGCIICGEEFYASPSSDKITCGRACAEAHRKSMHAAGKYDRAKGRMVNARLTDPRLKKGPENVNAKTWVIQSPTGEIFEFRNLLDWLRQHEGMLDGTVRQAWDGISKIKYSRQGKRKNPSHSWKGWELLDWGDE